MKRSTAVSMASPPTALERQSVPAPGGKSAVEMREMFHGVAAQDLLGDASESRVVAVEHRVCRLSDRVEEPLQTGYRNIDRTGNVFREVLIGVAHVDQQQLGIAQSLQERCGGDARGIQSPRVCP